MAPCPNVEQPMSYCMVLVDSFGGDWEGKGCFFEKSILIIKQYSMYDTEFRYEMIIFSSIGAQEMQMLVCLLIIQLVGLNWLKDKCIYFAPKIGKLLSIK